MHLAKQRHPDTITLADEKWDTLEVKDIRIVI